MGCRSSQVASPSVVGGAGGASGWRGLLALVQRPRAIAKQRAQSPETRCGHAGINPSMIRMPAVTPSTRGDMNSWLHDLAAHVPLPTRDTTMAAARKSAGRESGQPAHHRWPAGCSCRRLPWPRPCCSTPMVKPPTMLISKIRIPGHGIAAHELRGTVHGAEEVGFFPPRHGGVWLFSSIRPAFKSRPQPSACLASHPG